MVMKRTIGAQKIVADLKVFKESTVGWTKVDYTHGYKSRYHAIDIELWCEENCSDFKKFGTTFFFREAKDASMFIIKWL
jgi:hypothetical protein